MEKRKGKVLILSHSVFTCLSISSWGRTCDKLALAWAPKSVGSDLRLNQTRIFKRRPPTEYVHKHHSHVKSDQCYICSVSELNWTIMIPLMACLLLSIMMNIILFCRLKKRKQGYDLEERKPKMIEATSVKHQEKDRIEPRVERTWLLCRRSADVTDVWDIKVVEEKVQKMERKCLDVGDSAVTGDDMIRCCPVQRWQLRREEFPPITAWQLVGSRKRQNRISCCVHLSRLVIGFFGISHLRYILVWLFIVNWPWSKPWKLWGSFLFISVGVFYLF